MKIGGTTYCAAWITGSVTQNATVTGLGRIADNCSAGNCPTVYSTIFGTNGTGNTDPGCVPSASNPSPGCYLHGYLYCTNPASKSAKAQGNPFASTVAVLSGSDQISQEDCAKNGRCSASVTVEVDFETNPCANSNWTALAFVPSEFYGLGQLVTYDNKDQEQTLWFLDYCHVNLTSQFKPGQMYTCTQVLYE